MNDALIVFTPSGKRGRFALGTPVLTAARQHHRGQEREVSQGRKEVDAGKDEQEPAETPSLHDIAKTVAHLLPIRPGRMIPYRPCGRLGDVRDTVPQRRCVRHGWCDLG